MLQMLRLRYIQLFGSAASCAVSGHILEILAPMLVLCKIVAIYVFP